MGGVPRMSDGFVANIGMAFLHGLGAATLCRSDCHGRVAYIKGPVPLGFGWQLFGVKHEHGV